MYFSYGKKIIEDKKYKNIFEVSCELASNLIDNGSGREPSYNYLKKRICVEKTLFGYDYNSDPEWRPKYGVFDVYKKSGFSWGNYYGSAGYVKLPNHFKKHVTITLSDSLNRVNDTTVGTLKYFNHLLARLNDYHFDLLVGLANDEQINYKHGNQPEQYDNFIEAQVHVKELLLDCHDIYTANS